MSTSRRSLTPLSSSRDLDDATSEAREESAQREFVTNAAHELQSPLTAIVSAIEVLQAGAKDTPERDIFLGHIERASARLARLARALLILARVQTGAEAPRTELVALQPLLSDIASQLRPAEGVEVEVSCPPDAAAVTNRELIEQVLLNITENAAKYTGHGRIELAAQVSGGQAEVRVSDTGRGIPWEEQDRVFDRFYRGEGSGEAGSGLGLAIVLASVEAIGGHVDLQSSPGEGTTVSVRLPQGASMLH
jgi:signal transduction histidine kinase